MALQVIGSIIRNPSIQSENAPTERTHLANDTWTMYNSTSGSTSTISFHVYPYRYAVTGSLGTFTFGMEKYTWIRVLNGHTYKGLAAIGWGDKPYYYIWSRPRHAGSTLTFL
jgi:hypothetical protein